MQLMVRYCSFCGVEGNILSIKKRNLPISGYILLCDDCFTKEYQSQYEEVLRQNVWKEKLLRKFYEGKLKQLCRESGIPVYESRLTTAKSRKGTRYQRYSRYYFTYEELITIIINNLTVECIRDFALRNSIPVRDIIQEMQLRKNSNKNFEEQIDDELLKSIIEGIIAFKTLLPEYPNEIPYQIDLARYLLTKYPNLKVEEQRGSSRPDISIDDIAIEVKGPTYNNDIITLADKCLRYPEGFDRGMIIVLFKICMTSSFYDEWKRNFIKKYPDVHIIEKP